MQKDQNHRLRRARHHHAFHRVFSVAMLAVAALSSLGLTAVMFSVHGASRSMLVSLSITDPSQNTSPITSSPSTVIPGGGMPPALPYFLTPPEEANDAVVEPTLPPLPMTIEIVMDDGTVANCGTLGAGHAQTCVPRFSDSRPTFRGNVDVPFAILLFEVHSDPRYAQTASVVADAEGNWEWQPGRSIEDGPHVLYITVLDPTGAVKLGLLTMQFEIISSVEEIISRAEASPALPRTTVQLPPRLFDQRKVLFDIRTQIIGLNDDNVIAPGDTVILQVGLVNIGAPGYIVDTKITYRVLDEHDTVIYEELETIGVSTRISYIKKFATLPIMKKGVYRIETTIEHEDTTAASTSRFEIAGSSVIPLTETTRMNVSAAIQVLTLLLAVSALVAYNEYKQAEGLHRLIRQVNEDDLARHGYIG